MAGTHEALSWWHHLLLCGAPTYAAMSPASGRCQLRKCHATSIQAALCKGTPKLRRTASVPMIEAEHHQTPASTMPIIRMLSLSPHVPTVNRHCRLLLFCCLGVVKALQARSPRRTAY